MYHIGICDDDPIFIKYIKRLFREVQREIEFYEYLSGEALIQDMQMRESYDLLILDMQLPGMDGNETAKSLENSFLIRFWYFAQEYVCLRWNPLKQRPIAIG